MALKNAVRSKKDVTPASQNAFAGRTKKPLETKLKSVLGALYPLWTQLVSDLKRDLNLDGADWHSSGVKYGWSYRLQRKQRNIVYLGPRASMIESVFRAPESTVNVDDKRVRFPCYRRIPQIYELIRVRSVAGTKVGRRRFSRKHVFRHENRKSLTTEVTR